MQDIHAIRPPVPVGIDPVVIWIVLWAALGAAAAAAVFFIVRRYLKHRRSPDEISAIVEDIPPFDAAMEDLDRLLADTYSDPRQFYYTLSAVLRRYIGSTYRVRASEMTSLEFIRTLSVIDIQKEVKKGIIAFAQYSDPIKYAANMPDPGQVKADIGQVRQFIEQIHDDFENQAKEAGEAQ